MIYSTRIDDLRRDVAANCRLFVALMREAGFIVQIVNTVRDEEKQRALYAAGVTKSKVPTFHSIKSGLAFDICQGVKGHGYDNEAFWDKAGEIGEKMGFEWGWRWKSFPEKPHFQWSDHGKIKGSDILAGRLPPPMPLYREDENVTPEKFAELYNDINPMIADIDDPNIPISIKPEVQALLDKGAVNGGTAAAVNAKDINLRLDTLKAAVIAARATK